MRGQTNYLLVRRIRVWLKRLAYIVTLSAQLEPRHRIAPPKGDALMETTATGGSYLPQFCLPQTSDLASKAGAEHRRGVMPRVLSFPNLSVTGVTNLASVSLPPRFHSEGSKFARGLVIVPCSLVSTFYETRKQH